MCSNGLEHCLDFMKRSFKILIFKATCDVHKIPTKCSGMKIKSNCKIQVHELMYYDHIKTPEFRVYGISEL